MKKVGVSFRRLLDGTHVSKLRDIGHELREMSLIELVAAPVEDPHHRLGQRTSVVLQLLERYRGVVPAVIEIHGDTSRRRAPKSGGNANSGNSGPQNGVAIRKRPATEGRGAASTRYFSSTDAPNE